MRCWLTSIPCSPIRMKATAVICDMRPGGLPSAMASGSANRWSMKRSTPAACSSNEAVPTSSTSRFGRKQARPARGRRAQPSREMPLAMKAMAEVAFMLVAPVINRVSAGICKHQPSRTSDATTSIVQAAIGASFVIAFAAATCALALDFGGALIGRMLAESRAEGETTPLRPAPAAMRVGFDHQCARKRRRSIISGEQVWSGKPYGWRGFGWCWG